MTRTGECSLGKPYDYDQVVAIDFDGTITEEDRYPNEPCLDVKPLAVWAIKRMQRLGVVTVLWTCRSDIEEAKNICEKNGIRFDYVNEYPRRGNCKKVSVDMYIDDKNPAGCCWVLAVVKMWWRTKWSNLKMSRKSK